MAWTNAENLRQMRRDQIALVSSIISHQLRRKDWKATNRAQVLDEITFRILDNANMGLSLP
jgi:hypothetical protein